MALGFGSVLLVAGCVTPAINVVPFAPMAPSVSQVQNHLSCVLARTMDKHLSPTTANPKSTDYKLWHNLVEYNFLSTMNLTLFVTESENANPTYNAITPLTSLGNPIQMITDSSNGIINPANPTSNSNNLTLAVGLQLTGTQDRNFLLNYVVDMHRLYEMSYKVQQDGQVTVRPDGLLSWCDGLDRTHANGVPYGLKGDLALGETLESGLEALDAATYSPVTAGSGGNKASQSASSASVSQSAGTTAFSTKIDFTLLWGLNGGPNWSLLKSKGPSAAGGPLLGYTRSKQDTLISTFAPTCKSDSLVDLANSKTFFKPELLYIAGVSGATSFEIIAYRRGPNLTIKDLADFPAPLRDKVLDHTLTSKEVDALPDEWKLRLSDQYVLTTIALPADTSKLPYTYNSAATGTITFVPLPHTANDAVMNGTIAWSTFTSPGGDHGSYSLRGAVSDAQSGSFAGYILVGIGPNDKKSDIEDIYISKNAMDVILNETASAAATYWGTLPSCSIAGPFLPNGLSVLQQLPGGVSSALEQQR
jgi:hypothetical protein